MEAVRDVREFAIRNEKDLKKFMIYKTGIFDEEIIRETIQEFYVALIETNALQKYDPEKGRFDSYISNLFCWILPSLRRKNFRVRFDVISKVQTEYQECDVWDFVGDHNNDFHVDRRYNAYHVVFHNEQECHQYLREFIQYIKKTEKPSIAQRMITFILHRYAGCKSVDIAGMLKVAPNMVSIIKRYTEKKFKHWHEDDFNEDKKVV